MSDRSIEQFTIPLYVRRLGESKLVRNTLWGMVSRGLGLCLQAIYFILIARSLGPEQYGAFVGVVALVAVAASFASLGSGNLLVRDVAHNRIEFSRSLGASLSTITCAGSVLAVTIVLLARVVLPQTIPLTVVLYVAISDLLFYRFLDLAMMSFVATEQLSYSAFVNLQMNAARTFAAVIATIVFRHPNATSWALLYMLSSLVGGGASMLVVVLRLGRPSFENLQLRSRAVEGMFFAFSGSSQTVYNDIDKTVLARLSTLQATGVYGGAYRIIDVLSQPITALAAASYARFFKYGQAGLSGAKRFATRIVPFGALYGACIWCFVVVGSPLVVRVLGQKYQDIPEVLLWLAPLPLLRALHYPGSDALSGAGHQRLRCALQVGVALFNLAMNSLLIPWYSWRGAAWASIASDCLLAASVWIALASLAPNTESTPQTTRAVTARTMKQTVGAED